MNLELSKFSNRPLTFHGPGIYGWFLVNPQGGCARVRHAQAPAQCAAHLCLWLDNEAM